MKNNIIVKPGEWLGIVGGGQLGRMLAISATKLGIKVAIYAESSDCPAANLAHEFFENNFKDAESLDNFSRLCKAITFEFENIPLETIDYLASRTKLAPSAHALAISQDRLSEKSFLTALSIPTTPFHTVTYEGDLKTSFEKLEQGELILKTRRLGYDGKGQARITPKNAMNVYYDLKEVPAITEKIVHYKKEFSIISVRGYNGEFITYAPSDNIHEDHVLVRSIVPSTITEAQFNEAKAMSKLIGDTLNYIGVLAIEFFIDQNDNILVNEIAPRVHNSGHWTLDACIFDQFEQHVRAVCGWSLGVSTRHSDAVMHNLIADKIHDWENYAQNPHTSVHIYGKTEVRPGRKMGHVTELRPMCEKVSFN